MWTGQAQIRPGWAVFQGTAGDHAPHRHHAVQVVVGLGAAVELWAQAPGRLQAPAVVIAADCPHQLASGPAPLLLLYLERESALGRAVDDWCGGGARPLSAAQGEQLKALLSRSPEMPADLAARAAALILDSSARAAGSFHDARIPRSIAALPRPLPEALTLASVARVAGLSPSRYAHLFRAHAGMPLRPYLRWLRLQQALAELAHGANLTEAAYAAGFADSAHLSRSFRSTFGIAPQILRHPALSLTAATG